MGLDILQKLSCSKSVLLNGKAHLSPSGYSSVGKVLLRIEASGHFVNRVVHVVESISGLHLDAETYTSLYSIPMPQDETCAAESQILDHHKYTSTG